MFAALAVTCAALTACEDDGLVAIQAPDDQIDTFDQNAASKVDILWVVDNSESMLAEQEKVSTRFADFFSQLLISEVDYQIGVVTTDPDQNGVLRAYDGPEVPGCNGCRFVTTEVGCSNPGVNVVGLEPAEAQARLLSECQSQLVFRRLISAGIDGSPFEEGFVQAAKALGAHDVDPDTGLPRGNAPPENEGFLRPDASLYIIFVSDEDEGAKADGSPVRYYQRLFENLKGPGNENKVSVSAITGWPTDEETINLSEVCPILSTTFDNNTGTDDPRASEIRSVLQNRSGCVDESGGGTGSDFAETGSRYIELACRTGGVVSNMCEADYSTALDTLGANAAGLLRKFPLSKPENILTGTDCELFTDDDKSAGWLDCDGDDDTEGPLDGPICVEARSIDAPDVELVPRDNVSGWTYETSTNSIRFNGSFVPAPGSTVTIRYKLVPAGGGSAEPGDNGCAAQGGIR